jgi:mRNA-degrading endonuclease toxin of MazEF toxin-antitoxin module
LPTVRLERKLGKLSAAVMSEIKRAIAFALDLVPQDGYSAER